MFLVTLALGSDGDSGLLVRFQPLLRVSYTGGSGTSRNLRTIVQVSLNGSQHASVQLSLNSIQNVDVQVPLNVPQHADVQVTLNIFLCAGV